jgi:hypothetical protein
MRLVRTFDRFDIGEQSYRHVGEQPHERRDGKLTILVMWQSHCQQCSEPFTFVRPDRPAPCHPPRRCKRCSAVDATGGHPRNWRKVNKTVNLPGYSAPDHLHGMFEGETEHAGPRTELLAAETPDPRTPGRVTDHPPVASPQPRQTPSLRKRNDAPKPQAKGVFTDR